MNCPKCGVVAAAGAEECGACGIVFSRWRERPLRPSLSNTPLPSVAPPPVQQQSVPAALIIAGAIVFIIIGIGWTAHRRAARANEKGDLTAMLDDINNKGQVERNRIRREAEQGYRASEHDQAVAAAAAAKAARQLPPTITEAELRALIERDALFQDNVVAPVPKAFDARDYSSIEREYPAFDGALREQLIELDPPYNPANRRGDEGRISVKIPPAALYNVAGVNDRGDTNEIDVGRRRIETLTIQGAGDFKIETAFTYTYEHPVGKALFPHVRPYGHASLTRGADGWRVDSVTHE